MTNLHCQSSSSFDTTRLTSPAKISFRNFWFQPRFPQRSFNSQNFNAKRYYALSNANTEKIKYLFSLYVCNVFVQRSLFPNVFYRFCGVCQKLNNVTLIYHKLVFDCCQMSSRYFFAQKIESSVGFTKFEHLCRNLRRKFHQSKTL